MLIKHIEQIIILRMIYAYCLSLFSVHFFSSHSIANFKIRLINQQTGDCTDSAILHAAKLNSQTFPVPIKLKGGQRLLVKVKLLSLPANSVEVMVGQGVVSFDKNSIDNTLRVPIYDKQRGVEEVAICSIDFFLSGFEVDKHTSINPDKSRSRFEDWRQRTEDAVYSQMSYTLESERDSINDPNHIKIPSPLLANTLAKSPRNKLETQRDAKTTEEKEPTKIASKEILKIVSPRGQSRIRDSQEEQEIMVRKDLSRHSNKIKPFTLQNNVYLDQPYKKPHSQQKYEKKTLKQTRKLPPSNLRKRFALDSEEDPPRSEKKAEMSPQLLRQTVKENEEVLSKLKKYITHIEKEEQSPKHKRRRKKIKVEEFAAYNSQNKFVKFHVDHKTNTAKALKNLRAVRIIESQIKQSNDEKVIPQPINKFALFSLDGTKLVTFDALGFRSHCIESGQSEAVATILIPTNEIAVKIVVGLGEEGDFEGVIGLQEGEQMTIILNRLHAAEESILQHSQFKLSFDIRHTIDSKAAPIVVSHPHYNEVSFRQPNEIIMPEQDIKTRVGLLSCQPWGFVKSYAEGVIVSAQSKELMDKIDQQLPRLKEQMTRPKISSRQKVSKQTSAPTIREAIKPLQPQVQPRSPSIDYLDSSIKRANPLRRQAESINSIRNGNRNNYRFKERMPSKQIKQAWEEILFKRNLQEEKRRKDVEKQIRQSKVSNTQHSYSRQQTKEKRRILSQSNADSQNDSMTSSKDKKVIKIYEFEQGDDRRPVYPLRTFLLKISNVSITQPQAMVEQTRGLPVGKFVKFSMKDKVIYFTEVIFNGDYNSILWKLDGCIFSELAGTERLKIEIYETLNNCITTLGVCEIRVNRLIFLRSNHIYNGTISHDNRLAGQFTLGFEIEQFCPFEVIHQEDEETINLTNRPIPIQQGKRLKTLSHHSQKHMKSQNPKNNYSSKRTGEEGSEESMMGSQLQESLSMPMGLTRQ